MIESLWTCKVFPRKVFLMEIKDGHRHPMLIMRIYTALKGRLVGTDDLGNHYYEERFLFTRPERPPKRWVMFKGDADPTLISPQWHGWIHYTHESPLKSKGYPWEKHHRGNKTGTQEAYHPSGSLYHHETSDKYKTYEAWKP